MDGYTVSEAAAVLGVSTERVWELLARGILAGQPEGEAGMRVFLRPRPGPITTAEPEESRRPNGHDGEPNPFRELLTEFRNLTERYGQALLALGEARGEVASLRGRVELLEARIDLRLPPPAPAAEARSWTDTPEAPAAPPPEPEVPAPAPAEPRPSEPKGRRRRGRGGRSAIAGLAEALARADDPSPSELPPAREAPAPEPVTAAADSTEADAAQPGIAVAEDAPAAAVSAAMPAAAEAWGGLDADAGRAAPAESTPADALPVAEETMPVAEETITAVEAAAPIVEAPDETVAAEAPPQEPEAFAPEPVIAAAEPTVPRAEAEPEVEAVAGVERTPDLEAPEPVESEPEGAASAIEPVETLEPEAIAAAKEPIEAAAEPVDVAEAMHEVEPEASDEEPAVVDEAPEPVRAEQVQTAEPAAEPPEALEVSPEPEEAGEVQATGSAEPIAEEASRVTPEAEWEPEPASGAEPVIEEEQRTDLEFGAGAAFQVEAPPPDGEQAGDEGAAEGYTAQLHEPDWFTDADLTAAGDQEVATAEPGQAEPEAPVDALDISDEAGPMLDDEAADARGAAAPPWTSEASDEERASVERLAWGGASSEPAGDEAPEAAGEPAREEEVAWIGADEPADYAEEMEISTHAWRATEPAAPDEPATREEATTRDEPVAHEAATEQRDVTDVAAGGDESWDEEQVADARAMLAHANAVEWEVDDADAAAYPLTDDDEQRLHATMSASLPDDIWVEDWGAGAAVDATDAEAPEPTDDQPPTAASVDEERAAPAEDRASRLAMPGSRELDEALAALDALARPTPEPATPEPRPQPPDRPTRPPEPPPQPMSGDQIVERLRSQMAARREGAMPPAAQAGGSMGAGSGEQADWQHERRSPAARAFRRLRRIIPG
jgi:hypothetical protein